MDCSRRARHLGRGISCSSGLTGLSWSSTRISRIRRSPSVFTYRVLTGECRTVIATGPAALALSSGIKTRASIVWSSWTRQRARSKRVGSRACMVPQSRMVPLPRHPQSRLLPLSTVLRAVTEANFALALHVFRLCQRRQAWLRGVHRVHPRLRRHRCCLPRRRCLTGCRRLLLGCR